MVSIENRGYYLSKISETPKLSAFHNFIINKDIGQPKVSEINESDEIYFGIISAIQSNKKEAFENYYNKRNKSNPSKESQSPFVNDDFLIFSLIVGITKFGFNKSWLKNIVSLRSENAITKTLENLLNEDFYSTSNVPEIVLMFIQLNDHSLITNNFLNSTYKRIIENTSLFEGRNDFQILCTIRAYDLIIELKDAPEGSEISLLKTFNLKFNRRVKVITWIMQVCLLIALLYSLFRLPFYLPKSLDFINKNGHVFTVLGALGFTLLGNQIKYIRQNSPLLIMRFLGYPKELIKKGKEVT